ncbi:MULTISPECIES: hypothetical protein [Rhodococcus]|uniref:Uncharacterized protein n=2 Tax=Rhodococcus opacus TaxID=37919 RepID=C1BDC6_RHOOB|nr:MULTISPECIES: hypothetical protein [Rhodococcus]EID79997.1 hypothetical protein W59_10389 [Rhodococcus opacus RKJ300 = JCM 13270]KAF0965570.1 hypothetical protein MLGJGCBP_01268 [Rhodococcus sp. T7]QQZ18191.1 hypothetical protein GO592_38615 [Rhodococcus sp. 21391]UOT08107.1 hypothetical protein MPY17_37710 [Rhodococcus opacus]BAH55870.1 hypothetical protein ROP_pROB01-03710 [Rhodococcus opacus B4]
MRSVFAHQAVLVMTPDADTGAPGAAVTSALCTHWGRQPPRSLAPHHTHADRLGDEVRIRIVFAVDPARQNAVRSRIDLALATGHTCGPDGTITRWQLRSCGPAAPIRGRGERPLSRRGVSTTRN